MLKLIATTAIIASLAGGAFAKAHDQGVADGEVNFEPGQAKDVIEGPGISAIVSKGAQGNAKKDPANRGGVKPVVAKNGK